ncbi:hypothetical protein T03_8954 [Trichinella britovi]|uniref:Uncharacterized protein n=1 Tax=Trichinella britovi TaxID=45882 RepID=A0A0V1CYK4_TRIBR|nr:hypothetical protein T03_8954 [Trichinella britovi]
MIGEGGTGMLIAWIDNVAIVISLRIAGGAFVVDPFLSPLPICIQETWLQLASRCFLSRSAEAGGSVP